MGTQREVKRGFTLIELLIVIAIIAILALIAVPNFLEAQIRAKVSAARADMRTLATAVEAYSVDWGSPPPSSFYYRRISNPLTQSESRWAFWTHLTTPVAFISGALTDPFRIKGMKHPGGNDEDDVAFRSYWFQSNIPAYSVLLPAQQASIVDGLASAGITWAMYSIGPQRQELAQTQPMPIPEVYAAMLYRAESASKFGRVEHFYDSTNGTMSSGVVWRDSKGSPN